MRIRAFIIKVSILLVMRPLIICCILFYLSNVALYFFFNASDIEEEGFEQWRDYRIGQLIIN